VEGSKEVAAAISKTANTIDAKVRRLGLKERVAPLKGIDIFKGPKITVEAITALKVKILPKRTRRPRAVPSRSSVIRTPPLTESPGRGGHAEEHKRHMRSIRYVT
jgi:hypothetical protein